MNFLLLVIACSGTLISDFEIPIRFHPQSRVPNIRIRDDSNGEFEYQLTLGTLGTGSEIHSHFLLLDPLESEATIRQIPIRVNTERNWLNLSFHSMDYSSILIVPDSPPSSTAKLIINPSNVELYCGNLPMMMVPVLIDSWALNATTSVVSLLHGDVLMMDDGPLSVPQIDFDSSNNYDYVSPIVYFLIRALAERSGFRRVSEFPLVFQGDYGCELLLAGLPIIRYTFISSNPHLRLDMYPEDYVVVVGDVCEIMFRTGSAISIAPTRRAIGASIFRKISVLFDRDGRRIGFCDAPE